MTTIINKSDGIVNKGNWYRIKECMKKASNGSSICIGFIGGSITNGSLSSSPKTCYAYLVYEWWKNRFPNAQITYLNAGIGGTTSQFGVARVYDDLLCHNPDFCIVEFSVNDENNSHFEGTYEGLIRCIYGYDTKPALMLVHNVFYDGKESAEQIHLKVGKHYQLPCVSMSQSILPKVMDGTIPNRDITPDDLHPNDEGHMLVASVILHMLEQIYSELNVEEKESDDRQTTMPSPLTLNEYEHSKRYQNSNTQAVLNGFLPDCDNTLENFQNGWIATKLHDKIVFRIEARGIAIQYRKSIHRPTPVAKVIIDGDENTVKILDGNFEENWGDCLYIETIAEHMKKELHTVEIELIETHETDVVPFYLLSVIGSY